MRSLRAALFLIFLLAAAIPATLVNAQSATYVYAPQFVDANNHPLAGVTVILYNHGAAQNPGNVIASGTTDSTGHLSPGVTLEIGSVYDFTTSSPAVPQGQFTATAPRQLVLIPGPAGPTGPPGPAGSPGPTLPPITITGTGGATVTQPTPGAYVINAPTAAPAGAGVPTGGGCVSLNGSTNPNTLTNTGYTCGAYNTGAFYIPAVGSSVGITTEPGNAAFNAGTPLTITDGTNIIDGHVTTSTSSYSAQSFTFTTDRIIHGTAGQFMGAYSQISSGSYSSGMPFTAGDANIVFGGTPAAPTLSLATSPSITGTYFALAGSSGTLNYGIYIGGPSTANFPHAIGITNDAGNNTTIGVDDTHSVAGTSGRCLSIAQDNSGTYKGELLGLDCSGNLGILGAYTSASSRHLKDNISPFSTDELQRVLHSTKIVKYCYKSEHCKSHETREVGIIAEDTSSLIAGSKHDHLDVGTMASVSFSASQYNDRRIVDLESVIHYLRIAIFGLLIINCAIVFHLFYRNRGR
jgi:hypothetical protein